MGPWVHGGWAGGEGASLGDARFNSKTAEFYRENIELPFFNFFLKDKGPHSLPEAHYVFETGTNLWRKYDAWPPNNVTQKSRTSIRTASFRLSRPQTACRPTSTSISDPKKPVPYVAGHYWGMTQRYMVDDQRMRRAPSGRALCTSAICWKATSRSRGPSGQPCTFPRPALTRTSSSSSLTCTPGRFPDEKGQNAVGLGYYHQLVRGEVIRGKFRNSLEKPEPFQPGQPTKVEFEVSDTFHTFRRGHRIMVQVQSTWFPLIDINPGKFTNIYQATEADFQKTTQRVFRSKALPSHVKVGVLARP